MKLRAFLSEGGVSSRRGAEKLIAQGRVQVNGCLAMEPWIEIVLGQDKIEVDGKEIRWKPTRTFIVVNKPVGVISTASDDRGRRTVLDLIPPELGRLFPVGRLDKESEGLLILTDDGDLALRLTHPRYEAHKTYRVRIVGMLSEEEMRRFQDRLPLGDGRAKEAGIGFVRSNGEVSEYDVFLREGRKRQIRRMMHALGHDVVSLCRIEEAGVRLGSLASGAWRHLSEGEVRRLREEVGMT